MIYFIWKCKDCNNEFKEPKVDDFIYGQFVLYSATTKSKRYFDNSNVSVFEEVDMIIENNHRYKHVKERKKETVICQNVFSIACDKDEEGNEFFIGSPVCPECKSRNTQIVGPTDSPEKYEGEIPPVTHDYWNSLNQEEKEMLVDKKLHELGY